MGTGGIGAATPGSAPRHALAAIYDEEYVGLTRLAFVLLGDAEEARDVVHDAFVALARQDLARIDRPGAYLRTSVVHGAGMRLRRRARAARLPRPVEDVAVPAQLVELRDVLARLPERQRAAVVLRHVCDVDDDEIARILGCRPATVRSLVHRGLAVLRKELS